MGVATQPHEIAAQYSELGFSDLECFNQSLLAKHGKYLNFLTLFQVKYFPNSSIFMQL